MGNSETGKDDLVAIGSVEVGCIMESFPFRVIGLLVPHRVKSCKHPSDVP